MSENFDSPIERDFCGAVPERPDCPRCGMGKDTDGDGHCVVCVHIPTHIAGLVKGMAERILALQAENRRLVAALEGITDLAVGRDWVDTGLGHRGKEVILSEYTLEKIAQLLAQVKP